MQGYCLGHSRLQLQPSCIHRCGCTAAPVAHRTHLRSHSVHASVISLQSHFLGAVPAGLSAAHGASRWSSHARRRLQQSCKQTRAAIFGVGAPEALLVGVVALIVFGPKGLAEAVKSLGATFRAVSPTLKELVSASNDLRSSLEEQIGLDEIRNEFRTPSSSARPSTSYSSDNSYSSSGSSDRQGGSTENTSSQHDNKDDTASVSTATSKQHADKDSKYFSEDFDVDIEAKRREAAKLAWGTATGSDEPVKKSSDSSDSSGGGKTGAAGDGALAGLSLEDLEAELSRRKAARAGSSDKLQKTV